MAGVSVEAHAEVALEGGLGHIALHEDVARDVARQCEVFLRSVEAHKDLGRPSLRPRVPSSG